MSLCSFVKADSYGSAYQYDKYSENGEFYFKSIPYYRFGATNFGKTIVFDSKTNEELYSIDNYLPSSSFISNNGNSLVTVEYWMWGHDNYEDQVLITIYNKEDSAKHYRIDDLVTNKTILTHTVSHTLWYEKMFIKNDTLNILTEEGRVVRLDIKTGKIKSVANKNDFNFSDKIKNYNLPKEVIYNKIKYPKNYIFPDLKNGKNFKKFLITRLNKTEVEEYADCKYYILVYGTIDKDGKCEIFMLKAEVDGKENQEWKTQVSDWVTTQKYKTNLIPKNCDKWVFQEYFYLK